METRTDRVGLLLDQLETSLDMSRDRLAGLTDEEFLWEPVEGAWSVRRRADGRGLRPYGAGDWVIDFGRDRDDDGPEPVTTIAWRVCHLVSMFDDRWEWTFGGRSTPPEVTSTFTPVAADALEQLWSGARRWADGVAGLTDEQLDTVGFGQYPYGLDPRLPIVSIVWWMNRELIHHAAEACLLRDLYLRLGPAGTGAPARSA
jgi:hypothetical protein